MSPETTSPTKLCPTCGTRVSETATRCLVCGSELSLPGTSRTAKPIQGSRMPEITLSLPAILGIFTLIIVMIGGTYYYMSHKQNSPAPTSSSPSATATLTQTVTLTPTITSTATLVPTATPLPPISYTVSNNDTCSSLSLFFKVSINSIILLNNLDAGCTLSVGQKLSIPQPTPTASPQPTGTLSSADATQAACQKVTYTVLANDTLGSIAMNYNVSADAIRAYNGLPGDTVYEGQNLTIPLCARLATQGPTPTATNPPPYPAPNLLLPADGAPFASGNDVITLQWASVGSLAKNEYYEVVVVDVTANNGKQLVDYVTDTKYTIPTSFQPSDNLTHILRWYVLTVRQSGTDNSGNPIYISAGATSVQRVFSWVGGTTAATTTPSVTP
jgi:LysM repeat protein